MGKKRAKDQDIRKDRTIEYLHGPLRILDIFDYDDGVLSEDVCKILKEIKGELNIEKFADGDREALIKDSSRGRDIYVFQSYVEPIGERLYELALFLDASKKGGHVQRANVVMPFLFGSRGERRVRARQSVQALVVAKIIKFLGGDLVLTTGMHAPALGTIYNAVGLDGLDFENLDLEYVAAKFIINEYNGKEIAIVSPDVGGAKRVKKLASIVRDNSDIKIKMVIGDKEREQANVVKNLELIGSTKDLDTIILDDIADTLGTAKATAKACKEQGANNVIALLYHPVLGEGYENVLEQTLDKHFVDEFLFFDTIPLKDYAKNEKRVKLISCAPFIAEAIKRINVNRTVSGLHEYKQIKEAYRKANSIPGLSYSGNKKYVRIG
ncbi:MAG: ribose-phosphate diphosphokinase [Nanoarchaeota archaeon]|nr:ribose-phosphate diphosphokinase [Nanoarchaeota archaeon]